MPKTSVFNKISTVPTRLADSVSDAIAKTLLEGRIAPGEALPSEGRIADEFGVSKPIAREALRQLSSAGLIQTQQGKVARAKAMDGEPLDRFYGYAVRSSLKNLREANEMRMVIEVGVARLAARRRVAEGLEMMGAAIDDMRASLPDPKKFTEADLAFHVGIAMATGNAMLKLQVEGMRSVQREVSELFSSRSRRSQEDWLATVERHVNILTAVAAGDEVGTELAISAHYDAADIASFEVVDKLGSTELGDV